MSGPTNQVWKTLQPPFSTGSFEPRRVISVPQSLAASSTFRPIFFRMSCVTSACECTIGWSVADIRMTFSPL